MKNIQQVLEWIEKKRNCKLNQSLNPWAVALKDGLLFDLKQFILSEDQEAKSE